MLSKSFQNKRRYLKWLNSEEEELDLRVKASEIDYKNVDLLKRFVSDKGRINPSRVTGANAKLQRKIAKAIKKS